MPRKSSGGFSLATVNTKAPKRRSSTAASQERKYKQQAARDRKRFAAENRKRIRAEASQRRALKARQDRAIKKQRKEAARSKRALAPSRAGYRDAANALIRRSAGDKAHYYFPSDFSLPDTNYVGQRIQVTFALIAYMFRVPLRAVAAFVRGQPVQREAQDILQKAAADPKNPLNRAVSSLDPERQIGQYIKQRVEEGRNKS